MEAQTYREFISALNSPVFKHFKGFVEQRVISMRTDGATLTIKSMEDQDERERLLKGSNALESVLGDYLSELNSELKKQEKLANQ